MAAQSTMHVLSCNMQWLLTTIVKEIHSMHSRIPDQPANQQNQKPGGKTNSFLFCAKNMSQRPLSGW